MKVIITGSEGFIGSALSLALQKRGIEVIGIDRKNGQEAADIAKYMPDDLDAVFHLAAQTSVFNTDLIQIRKDNIDSFMAVVEREIPVLVYRDKPPNRFDQFKMDSFWWLLAALAVLGCITFRKPLAKIINSFLR